MNFIPYDDSWKKEMMKFSKKQLVEMISISYQKTVELSKSIEIKPEEKIIFGLCHVDNTLEKKPCGQKEINFTNVFKSEHETTAFRFCLFMHKICAWRELFFLKRIKEPTKQTERTEGQNGNSFYQPPC